jgi:large subunit ribosomal protein L15
MPLQRRIPKQGFRRLQKNTSRREQLAEVNLKSLAVFADGTEVDPALMNDRGLIGSRQRVKVLGSGDIEVKLTVRAHAFSKSARDKIIARGGVAELIEG